MDNPTPRRDTLIDPPSGGSYFDDPALEAAFGLANPSDWIARARQAEIAPPSPGTLGHYELIEEIGRGGQGVVYKAVQPGTGRTIAIKCFHTGPLKSGKRDRFQRETQALIRLHHPSIVTIHGAEVINGCPTLVMEHVEGTSIDQWADGDASGRRPRSQILSAFGQVCDAVSHAHQRGVIHRDLKPSNVLVDESGTPHVLDFGISRLVDDLQSGGAWTMTGFAGTPSYSSPEQLANSADADTRTDVYSLGVLLYRILTGSEAFPRTLSLPSLITAIRAGQIRRPSEVLPTLPQDLDWVVLKAVNPDSSMRYQTVDALGADVRRFLNGEPVAAHPPSSIYIATKFVRNHSLACGLALAVALVITTLSILSITQSVRLSRQNLDLTLAVERESLARKAADDEGARANAQAASQREVLSATASIIESIAVRANRVANVTAPELLGIIEPELARLPEPAHPEARVQYYVLRARVATSAHKFEQALAHWTKAIEAVSEFDTPDPALLALLYEGRGSILSRMGRFDQAQTDSQLAMMSPDEQVRFRVMATIRYIKTKTGDLDGARDCALTLLDMAGPDPSFRAVAFECMSTVEETAGNLELATTYMVDCVAVSEDAGRGESLDAARHRVRLANLYLHMGNVEAAARTASEAARIRLKKCGPMHIRTEQAVLPLAEALSRLGRFAESAAALEIILPRIETVHGETSQILARHRFKLAAAYLGAGNDALCLRNLALAISGGSCADASHVHHEVDTCQVAIAAAGFRLDRLPVDSLGHLSWLLDSRRRSKELVVREEDSDRVHTGQQAQ